VCVRVCSVADADSWLRFRDSRTLFSISAHTPASDSHTHTHTHTHTRTHTTEEAWIHSEGNKKHSFYFKGSDLGPSELQRGAADPQLVGVWWPPGASRLLLVRQHETLERLCDIKDVFWEARLENMKQNNDFKKMQKDAKRARTLTIKTHISSSSFLPSLLFIPHPFLSSLILIPPHYHPSLFN